MAVAFRGVIGDGQAEGTGEELLHHPLSDGAGLFEAALQSGDLCVHVGEEGGNGALLGDGRQGNLCTGDVGAVGCMNRGSCR